MGFVIKIGLLLVLAGLAASLWFGQTASAQLRSPGVVGTGTPASCTETAFTTTLALGGNATFNCGSQPFTLTLTQRANVVTNTVVDGVGWQLLVVVTALAFSMSIPPIVSNSVSRT